MLFLVFIGLTIMGVIYFSLVFCGLWKSRRV